MPDGFTPASLKVRIIATLLWLVFPLLVVAGELYAVWWWFTSDF